MPLLVVLLVSRLGNEIKDPPREVRLSVLVRHGDVGHVFPGLVGHASDDLEYLELGERSLAPVEQIHADKEHAREKPVPHARRRERLLLFLCELRRSDDWIVSSARFGYKLCSP